LGVVGFFLGHWVKVFTVNRRADEDVALWDYVAKHPQDFPEIERK